MKFAESSRIITKTLKLKPGGGLNAQKPGDFILLTLARSADQAADTCGKVFVMGIEVRYWKAN